MTGLLAEGVKWNLGDLYASMEDPKIETDLKFLEEKAAAFQNKYKAPLETLTLLSSPNALVGDPGSKTKLDSRLRGNDNQSFPLSALLSDYKELVTVMIKLSVFSHLSFAQSTSDAKVAAFMQKIRVRLTDIQSHMLFFDVLWNQLDETLAQKMMSAPEVQADRHFLEKIRVYAPHTLTEGEEKIMAIKSNTGGSAFSRLFDEVMNSIPFYVTEKGARVKKSEAEVLSLFHSSDRGERKMASDSLAEGLKANTHLLTYIYNMIMADHRSSMKIRNYQHAMDPMNLSNEISLQSVTNLVGSVKKAYPIAHRYYRMKKKLLGLETLFDYDRYAPLRDDEGKVTFDEAKQIVLSGYYGFSDQVGKIIEEFFDKRWIDAEIRDGKQGGAFCCQTTPDLHPYVLMNFTGSLRDVMTLAHELGHGLHQYLAGKKVGVLESDAPLTLAETASVFGEMLIFEKILEKEKDPKKRLGLLCGKIDDNFATVFRQICMTDFELMAHSNSAEHGELSHEKLSDFWIKANAEFYGNSVTLTDNYRHGWKYIPHFVHTPFYCYAYSFAQLFVLSLYQKYKEDKSAFVPKYLEMLSLGGSRKPEQIAAIQNLNILDPHFFDSGLKLLDELVVQAEALT